MGVVKNYKSLSLWLIISMVVFLRGSTAMAEQIKDVPPDHWAYSSVKLLVDKGYITLYQDGTFQGNKPVDRYTLAAVIARMLNEIASGKVAASTGDVQLLRQLSSEFRQELVSMGTQLDNIDKQVESQNKVLSVMKEDVLKATYDAQEAQKQAQKILEDLKALAAQSADLSQGQANLSKRVDQLSDQASKLDDGLNSLAGQLGTLESRSAEIQTRVDNLEGTLASLKTKQDAQGTELAGLSTNLESTASDLGAVARDLAGVKQDLSGISGRVDTLEKGLSDAASQSRDLGAKLDKELVSTNENIAQLRQKLDGTNESITQLGQKVEDLNSRVDAIGNQVAGLEKGLQDAMTNERAARMSADSAMDAKLGQLSSDFESYKSGTSKDLQDLRKENGLLKVLLVVAAVLGIAF